MDNFRQWYKDQWKLRLVDFLGHIVMGLLLVLLFRDWNMLWYQWLPDMCLLVMWPYSMITNKKMAETNWFVKEHKSLHRLSMIFACALVTSICYLWHEANAVIVYSKALAVLITHQFVDQFTHGESV